MIDTDLDAVTICLYLAIPEKEESRVEIRPWPRRLRSLTKHSLDRLATRLSHRLHLDLYHYGAVQGIRNHSNRGDIAIRMAIKQQLTKAFAPRPVAFLEVKWGELTDDAVERINHSCDIFVIGGGGYMFINASGSVGHMLENVEELGRICCPIFAYGIGLNRLMHEKLCDLESLPEASRQKIRYLASRCQLISVRDAEAAKLFELYAAKFVALTGDPVLSYRAENHPLSPRREGRPVIGINLAAHGWRALSILKPLLPTIIGFLKDIQRTHRCELLYLQHHDLERPVIDFLRAEGLRFELVYGPPDDLLNGYARTDFVICQMLHASIFAVTAGKPFLSIAYDDKSVAFGKLLGMTECCLLPRDVEPALLEKAFASLFEDRAALGARLDRRKRDLRLAQTRFAEQLVAEADRLASQYDLAGKDDQPEDLPYLSDTEIGAIMKQAGDTGSRLH